MPDELIIKKLQNKGTLKRAFVDELQENEKEAYLKFLKNKVVEMMEAINMDYNTNYDKLSTIK